MNAIRCLPLRHYICFEGPVLKAVLEPRQHSSKTLV